MRHALVWIALAACGKHHEHVSSPDRDAVRIVISTDFPGATATDIAHRITTPIEHQVGQVPDLQALHSRSTQGHSEVIAEFPAGSDPFEATQAVMKATAAVSSQLPSELASPPVIRRAPQSGAVLRLALTSETQPLLRVSRIAREMLAQKLAEVAGVGRIEVCGAEPEIRITVDPGALARSGATIEDLRTEISRADLAAAAPVGGPGVDAETFRGLPTVRDTATVEVGVAAPDSCVAFAGDHRAVAVTVTPQSGTDELEVRERLEALLPKLAAELSAGVHLDIWPRTRPVAFEIALDPASSMARRLDDVQHALADLHLSTRVLVQLALPDRDPDLADLRIVPAPHREDLEASVTAAFERHHLTVRDRHDHVVGVSGLDPATRAAQLDALVAAIARVKELRVVERVDGSDRPQRTLAIDRGRAAELGVDPSEVETELRVLAPGGMWVATVSALTEQTRVMLGFGHELPAVLDEVMVRSRTSGLVPLSAVVTATESREPQVIFHEGQVPWIGVRVAGSLDALDAVLAKLPVPPGIRRDVREPD